LRTVAHRCSTVPTPPTTHGIAATVRWFFVGIVVLVIGVVFATIVA
jgi:hypothetical protein